MLQNDDHLAKNHSYAGLTLTDIPGKGRAVVTTRSFQIGEMVLEFIGVLRDVESLDDLTHALQVGPRTFLSSSGQIDDYVNHSCRPNTGIRDIDGKFMLFALRPLEIGEEVTFDYATTQNGGHSLMECQCGEPCCRGKIGDFEALPSSLKMFYKRNRALLSYLEQI